MFLIKHCDCTCVEKQKKAIAYILQFNIQYMLPALEHTFRQNIGLFHYFIANSGTPDELGSDQTQVNESKVCFGIVQFVHVYYSVNAVQCSRLKREIK